MSPRCGRVRSIVSVVRGRLRVALPTVAALVAVALTGELGPIEASQIRPLNLPEMAQRAERIFSGRCVDVRVEIDPELGVAVTHITFAADRSIKGDVRGTVTIKMLGEPDVLAGLPVFHEGEEVVLFLYGESARGLTSPVGFGQGKFVVQEDKQGRRLAVNGFANEYLFRNLSAEARQRIGPAADRGHGRGALPVEELLDLVHTLTGDAEPGRRP